MAGLAVGSGIGSEQIGRQWDWWAAGLMAGDSNLDNKFLSRPLVSSFIPVPFVRRVVQWVEQLLFSV